MPARAKGINRRQEENDTAQYYRRGGKGKGHLVTRSTRAKISCMEELNKRCESMGVRWLLSYHSTAPCSNQCYHSPGETNGDKQIVAAGWAVEWCD